MMCGDDVWAGVATETDEVRGLLCSKCVCESSEEGDVNKLCLERSFLMLAFFISKTYTH